MRRVETGRASDRGGLSRLLVLLIIAPAYLMALAFQAPLAGAHPALAADDTKHAVHLASPAVVRIIMQVKAQVTCDTCNGGAAVVEPNADQVYVDTFSGSGTFVSPDGFILTANHVVDADESLVGQAADDFATATGISQSSAEDTFFSAFAAGHVHINYDSKVQRVFLSTGYTGSLTAQSQLKGFDVQSVAASSPVDQQDTAIIKINVKDMPFLTLASKSDVNVQDTVTAVAYPGDADTADFSSLLTPATTDANSLTSLLTPTVETGSIIKQDTLDDGSIAYETTDISFHGSSGGAVINSAGQIVGFVDRFTSDPSSTRVTILYSSNTASTYTKKAGIPAAPTGAFMSKWSQAISEYDATNDCHFNRAATYLAAIKSAYPQFGGVQPYLDDANAKATQTQCATTTTTGGTTSGNTALIIGLATGALILALAGLAVILILSRRRDTKPAPAITGGYGASPTFNQGAGYPPYSPTPGYPQAGAPTVQAQYPPAGSPPPLIAPRPQPPQQPTPQYPAAYPQPQAPQQPQQPPTIRQAGPMRDPNMPGGPNAQTILAQRPNFGQLGQGGQQQNAATNPASPRRCVNGHEVANPNATYCPVCGAPM